MLEKLYKKRKNFVENMKANDYNGNEIIANLYSENSHFIYELLQNAEDSEASVINFDLKENYLEILHNGKLFSYDDVNAITTVGSSTKKDDLNKIGKFGAGFKSVFAITSSPKIYSGEYSFEIVDYIVPKLIDNVVLKGEYTKIILPLNSNKIEKEKAYKIISEKLENLESQSLLFLKNINSINWSYGNKSGSYNKKVNSTENCQYIDISTIMNETSYKKSYIKIDKAIKYENKDLTLCVAYGMKDNKIIPIENSMLSVYFPTKVSVYYKFLLQAPYKTTPNRESIPFEDEDNRFITSELSKLVANSFLVLKEENLLDIEFLESMRFDIKYNTSNELYMSTYNEIKKAFIENELLPTACNQFTNSTNLIIARNKDLIELIKDEDIEKLTNKKYFFGKSYGSEFTYYLNRKLGGVSTFENDDLLSKMDMEFLLKKDDLWLISFYKLLSKQSFSKLYLYLRPIIKLNNNEFVPLYKDNIADKPQVYLPTEVTTRFKTLNKLFIENQELKGFIDKYKIIKPDYLAELEEFVLSKYVSTPKIGFDEYIKDLDRIVEIYSLSNEKDKNKIIESFYKKHIVLCEDETFCHVSSAVFPTDENKIWFKYTKNVKFVSNKLLEEKYSEFLKKLDIPKTPKNWLDAIHDFKNNMSFENSLILWNVFIKKLEAYTLENSESFSALNLSRHIVSNLKYINWLKSNDSDELKKPSEIIFEELDKAYQYPKKVEKMIIENIEFKPTKIKQIEDELNGVFVDKNEFEEFKKWKDEKDSKNIESSNIDEVWSFDTSVNSITAIQVSSYKSSTYRPNLSYQAKMNYPNKKFNNGISKNYNNIQSRKAIGDWGEKFVNNYLLQEYKNDESIEVKWLNQDNNLGIGYDFVMLKDNIEIEYIEVKSKVSYHPSSIEISGTQWEWARSLYNNENGDKFKIYVVMGAGKNDATINIISNPIKLWKDGELKASIVNIEL